MESNGSFSQAIRDAARRSAVRVIGGSSRGSGFFARPGVVLTCAHVVGLEDTVTVEWDDRDYSGRVIRRYPDEAESDRPELWPFPDVAVIRLERPPRHHPVPYFTEDPPVEGHQLVAYGFTDGYLQPGPQRDGVLVTTTGASGDYQRVKDDQIVPGMSGSLVISTSTGLVAGMIKASRSSKAALGGWIIPSSVLSELIDNTIGMDDRIGAARPVDVWTDALLSPIRALLKGQIETAAALPYRLMDPPVPRLGDVYVKQQTEGGQGPVEVAQMLTEHQHALIIGQPGSGKTSLVQQICSLSAQWWLHRKGSPPFGRVIPVRMAASSFSAHRPFLESLASSVQSELGPLLDAPATASLFNRAPLPGVSWLIMIDGLDEVIDSDQRLAILRAIEQRIQDLEQPQRILVTTRPLLLHELATADSIPRFELLVFNQEQMKDFARNWFTTRREVVGASSVEEAEQIADRFAAQVEAANIESLAEVPLLLTIAAIVFEKSPSHELPPTITTLYEQFVDFLSSRQGLTSPRPEALSPDAAWIWEKRAILIENIAYQWFFGSGQSVFNVALELVTKRKDHVTKDTAQLRDYLRAVLTHSGVVVVAANDLEWLHLSIAEYLASRMLARKATPEQWLWLADRPTTANIARLALVHFVRTRELTSDFIKKLPAQDSARLSLRELLGTPGLLTDKTVADLTRSAEASRELEAAPFGAYPAAAAVLRVSLDTPNLRRKLASAKALIKDGSPSDVRAGINALVVVSSSPWFRRGRLLAIDQMVVTVRQRPDAGEFEQDIYRAQRRGRAIVESWWHLPGRRVQQAFNWSSSLPPEIRSSILTAGLDIRWIPSATRIDAAYTLAKDLDSPLGIEFLEESQERISRFQTRDGIDIWRLLQLSFLPFFTLFIPFLIFQFIQPPNSDLLLYWLFVACVALGGIFFSSFRVSAMVETPN